jgi:tRNA (guanine37-N1)-methyltransferase
MKFTLLTLFPDLAEVYFKTSIMGRAVEKGLVDYRVINFRDYARDRHRSCDDYPYGGGPGMILKAEPLGAAMEALEQRGRVIFPSPSGRLFTQETARRLSQEESLVFICGRYEGLDQRFIDEYIDEEICLGDYILSSGEIAALVIIDGIFRLLDGVISQDSLREESFAEGFLEYPQYTRPEVFMGRRTPEILLSGHHENIRRWRLKKALEKTLKNRPDLLTGREWNKEIREIIEELTAPGQEEKDGLD